MPSVVKLLRVRATHFIQRLQRVKNIVCLLIYFILIFNLQNCPDSVPYTLAVYNSKSLSSSSESKETLTKQVYVLLHNHSALLHTVLNIEPHHGKQKYKPLLLPSHRLNIHWTTHS